MTDPARTLTTQRPGSSNGAGPSFLAEDVRELIDAAERGLPEFESMLAFLKGYFEEDDTDVEERAVERLRYAIKKLKTAASAVEPSDRQSVTVESDRPDISSLEADGGEGQQCQAGKRVASAVIRRNSRDQGSRKRV